MEFNNIEITHFVNPHKFWFKLPSFDKKFIEFDIKLQIYLKKFDPIGGNISSDPNVQDTFKTNQVVAYFDTKWQRWFRGTIQADSDSSEINIFLLDFGFPIVTNVKFIRIIPTEFQIWINENLKCGVINQIVPATAELDIALLDIQMSITKEWSSNAINIVKKIIAESSGICFISEFELCGQLFGKLYAIRPKVNVKQEISNILIKLQYAVFAETIINKFQTRPMSSMSNVSINFSRSSSPMTGPVVLNNDFDTNVNSSFRDTDQIELNNSSLRVDHRRQVNELSKSEINSNEVLIALNNDMTNSTLLVDTNELSRSGDSPIVYKPNQLYKPEDDLVEIREQCDQTVSGVESSNVINSPQLTINSKTPVHNKYRTRKLSNQSEMSSTGRSILDYSESDIDSCITSSPHLAKILNKMRTIRQREQAKLNHSYIATENPTIARDDIDNHNIYMQNKENSQCNKYTARNITEYFDTEHLANNKMNDPKCEDKFDVVTEAGELRFPQSFNPPANKVETRFIKKREPSSTDTFSKKVNGESAMDSNNKSIDNLEIRETCLPMNKTFSHISFNATPIIKSHDSAQHSNSARNDYVPSNLKVKPLNKIVNGKISISNNKSIPSNDPSKLKNKPETIKAFSELINADSSIDSKNNSIENFESGGTCSKMRKQPSDTSSIATSTNKTNNSARHSNSADNEFSQSSNLKNDFSLNDLTKLPHHKVFTKKLRDPGNKYEKSSDASSSDSSQKCRPYIDDDVANLNQNKKHTFFEKEQKHIVLVHGHTAMNPVESLEQVNFSKNIHHALDQQAITRLFRIDSYTWPHCLNGTSFVVIGAEKTGKTMSYLPSLINLILMEEEDNDIIDGVGPIALIVAPTSEKVVSIFKICKKFNRYLDNKLTICKGHGIPNDKLAMNLLNGVHILISTPECLDLLFDSSVYLINPERIKFFVIDDYHLMTDQTTLIKKIIRSSCIINPETKLYEQQIIVTSLYWDNTFMAMLNKTNNSFICIGSYMESAYYAKQDIKLLFMRQEDKLNKLNEILSNKDYRLKHNLIVCRDSTEVASIVKYLSDWNLDVIGCSRQDSSEMCLRLINEWNDRNDCSLNIVVCTDDILPELHLTRIKVLIHFSLPMSWSKFQYRYSTFFESMPNLLKNESVETKSIVFIDETNNSELPRFIDFLKIHGVKNINPAIEHISDEIRNKKEIEKGKHKVDVCKYMLKLGVCKQQNVCQYRHKLTDLDKPIIQLATKKYIKFTVAHIYTPAHFGVILLGTRDTLNDTWTEFDRANYKIFNINFKLHYSVKKNHMPHPTCNKGDLCTLNVVEKFYRCKITNVGEKRGILSDRRVVVEAYDVGEIFHTTESRLLYLPDQFKTIPPKLVHMRLGGLIPIHNEIKWPTESTHFVQKYFIKQEQNSELFLEASSSFIITETIFVDSIVFKRDLGKFGGGELEVRNFKTDMIKNQIGFVDEKNFNYVKDLIRAAGFEVFELNIQPKIEQNGLSPSSPPKENVKIIPTIAPHTLLKEENSLTIPIGVENPMLIENIKSDSIFGKNTSDDESRINLLSNESVITNNSSPKSNKLRNRKLGVSLPNKIESINLCCFNSPLRFCVQKLTSLSVINARLFDIQDYLIESNRNKLENFTIGDICLVFYDGYFDRAEIISVCNDEVMVNICDLGFTSKYSKNDLYVLDETIKNQPFEAIECQLFGVKPIGGNEETWDENCIDDIYDYINDNYTDHYVKKMIEIKREERPKFSVMLCGYNNDRGMEIVNKVLVEKGWAEYEEEEQVLFKQAANALVTEFSENIMSVVLHNNNSDEFDEQEFDNNLTYEECIEMFNFPEKMPSAKITEITEDEILDNTPKIMEIQETSVQNNVTDQIISYGNDPPPLVSCYNMLPLETLWHQDATTIVLKINVTDHVAYQIEVHKRFVNVCVQFDVQTYREITINLFGVVNINNFEHSIIGNFLKIVLTKSIQMNLLWPRLLLLDRKFSWLRYNHDSIMDTDLKDDDNYIQYKIKCMESSSDTDSDEQLDEDDECDPLSNQYNFVENKYFDENEVKMIS